MIQAVCTLRDAVCLAGMLNLDTFAGCSFAAPMANTQAVAVVRLELTCAARSVLLWVPLQRARVDAPCGDERSIWRAGTTAAAPDDGA